MLPCAAALPLASYDSPGLLTLRDTAIPVPPNPQLFYWPTDKYCGYLRSKSSPAGVRRFVMADPALLSGQAPPSPEERDEYYYGLPSKPKLVARSGGGIWRRQQDQLPIGKVFSPVGSHAIGKAWNDSTSSLRRLVLEALEDIDWSVIDILRLGYERQNQLTGEEYNHPVTLLISIQKDSTTWGQGLWVVMQCHDILCFHDFLDIYCEMKESRFSRCMSPVAEERVTIPRLVGGHINPPVKVRGQLSEYLGVSIAAFDEPGREGTKCLYLGIKGSSDSGDAGKWDKIVALTCRHVVFKEYAIEPEFIYRQDDVQSQRTIIQPGDGTVAELEKDIRDGLKGIENVVKIIQSYKNKTDDEKRRQIEIHQGSIPALKLAQRDLAALKDLATRIFGHVLYAPEFSVGMTVRHGTRLRDWALIELHTGKHNTPLHKLSNDVLIGDEAAARSWVTAAREVEGLAAEVSVAFDQDSHTAWLEGTIPEEEMRKPQEESRSLGDEAIMVAKHGRSSGFTVGLATRIMSLVREPMDGITFISEEWCIVGQGRGSDGRRRAFSEEGDSGSCVWDIKRRVGGMLTGGSGRKSNGAFDTSYATPIEWLLDDIKAHGYDVELL
ncbi:hypothetical protein FALBO_7396 [Fusarium albosuccineum]|uniref:Uncharacterized protein n=1 Tax=Fusarium albosuccineum TaxID=1237068 RepID=A0A8H4LCZ0_9HYPO|nr:hypothetical protein FALBO_7396 [Fusarium albosuccineum]